MVDLSVGSLFSGVGGIEIGFERQGFKTVWFVECELYCQAILRKQFPEAKIYGDVTKVDFGAVPKVDVLTGGFPCQDISNAGKRVGITGSRSSLWKHYLRAISTLLPRFALIENVAALVNRGLDVVLCDLASVGYDAEWYNLSASAVGALHRRERLFIVAYPADVVDSFNDSDRAEGRQEGEAEGLQGISGATGRSRMFGGASENANEGSSTDVSNTSGFGQHRGLCEHGKEQSRLYEYQQVGVAEGCEVAGCDKVRGEDEDVSNTDTQRLEGQHESEYCCGKSKETFGWGGFWAVEPELGRVVDGVSHRVDRIKCLGNAVVPQVAEVFAQAIKEVILNGK